ncbi:serine protease inhibitor Kazal-type 6-like [Zootoca vivipara]|uniref:serine protease inhibitor Kazal-type 6-like n=1 Tax=Zootoca vivipara TaxID=8524 RepID=UPI00293BE1BD|nr:serine protease inhibitor Kazal-type 6-like [Zootoca vivipara]
MGAFVVVALALWCFTGIFGYENVQANTMDCSEFRQAKGLMLCTKIAKPVCGTDDTTYISKCDLCRQNLESNKNVGVKYEGQCIQIQDYCKGFGPDDQVCPFNFMPHCGSDGNNYSNQCDFCINALKSKGALLLQHFGMC